jgi:uncharacterized protein (DUF2141 family)
LAQNGAGAMQPAQGSQLPEAAVEPLRATTHELLALADDYYASGDAGLRYLGFRCRLAVYTARLVYSTIGRVVRKRGCDPRAPRAFVSRGRKLALAMRALFATASAALLLGCASVRPTVEAKPSSAAPAPAPAYEAASVPPQATGTESTVSEPTQSQVVATPPQPTVGQVVVDVIGIEKPEGQLVVSLFREGRGFPDKAQRAHGKKVAKARHGHARLVFDNVPSGPFAVVVLHDANADFAMETGLFGKPEEGYGFSRDAHAPFGPPDFDDAKLTLAPNERKRVPIHLRY